MVEKNGVHEAKTFQMTSTKPGILICIKKGFGFFVVGVGVVVLRFLHAHTIYIVHCNKPF